jgi:integrase
MSTEKDIEGAALAPENHDFVAPLERQSPGRKLDGTEGLFRVDPSLPRMIRANNDLEAIHEWLETTTKPGSPTRRSYRKEAERLLAWAIVEKRKPISSLDMQDIRDYREFLAKPVSVVGVLWTAHERYDEKAEEWVPVETDANGKTIKKRHQRSDPQWKPFDGPLSPSSVDFSLRVLKGFFNFLNQFGYLQLNPMALTVKSLSPIEARKDQVAARSLDLDTWQFIYQFIQQQKNKIPAELDGSPRDRLYWIRTWNRNQVVFATLYLLGVRISELQGLRMNDFHRRQLKNPHTGRFATTWWVKVLGKGNKIRDIPVPDQLIDLIREYRQTLNNHPHKDRVNPRSEAGRGVLAEELGADDSTVIRNLSGNLGISTNRLQVSIKEVLARALDRYEKLKDDGAAPPNVDVQKLRIASAHWLRHTSATHQGYGEIDDGQLQLNLGHVSIDTTRIYKHEDEALRADATRGFKINLDQMTQKKPAERAKNRRSAKFSGDSEIDEIANRTLQSRKPIIEMPINKRAARNCDVELETLMFNYGGPGHGKVRYFNENQKLDDEDEQTELLKRAFTEDEYHSFLDKVDPTDFKDLLDLTFDGDTQDIIWEVYETSKDALDHFGRATYSDEAVETLTGFIATVMSFHEYYKSKLERNPSITRKLQRFLGKVPTSLKALADDHPDRIHDEYD